MQLTYKQEEENESSKQRTLAGAVLGGSAEVAEDTFALQG